MKLLLDTHILLWALSDAKELSPAARSMIDAADRVYVSSASFWEVAIKVSVGKLAIDIDRLHQQTQAAGFEPLSITWLHALAVSGLPALHRDPFDRMLVAQAMSEPLHFLTQDELLAGYGSFVTLV